MKARIRKNVAAVFAVLVVSLLAAVMPAAADDVRGSSSPVSATYITPGAWYSYTSDGADDCYYTAVKKAGAYYYAHVSVVVERPMNKVPDIDLGIYDDTQRLNETEGYVRKGPVTTNFSENIAYYYGDSKTCINYGSRWVRIAPGEQVIVKVKERSKGDKYRFRLDYVEDQFPDSIVDLNGSHVFKRGDVIKDAIAGSSPSGTSRGVVSGDVDHIRFQTDANTLYHVTLKCEQLNDGQGNPYLYLLPMYNGSQTSFGLTPGNGTIYFMTYGNGYLDPVGNTYFNIQLKPNTTYEWRIRGTNCRYEVVFDKISLEDIHFSTSPIRFLEKDQGYPDLDPLIYHGKPVTPEFKLSVSEAISFKEISGKRVPDDYQHIEMQEGTDYTVSYENNDKIGNAFVVLTGVGNVTGTKRFPFTIKADYSAPKSGTALTDKSGNGKYKVTVQGAEVAYTKPVKAKSSVKIPAQVKIGGITYTVTSIANNAFKGDKKLKSVTIGSNIKTIGKQAFMNCTSLKKIVIPSSVGKIGAKAFYNCRKLATVTFKTTSLTAKNVGAKAFKGTAAKAKVKVLPKVKKAYKKWLYKKGFSKKIAVR